MKNSDSFSVVSRKKKITKERGFVKQGALRSDTELIKNGGKN